MQHEMADFFVRELSNCAGCGKLDAKGTDWPIALSRTDDLRFIDRPGDFRFLSVSLSVSVNCVFVCAWCVCAH